MTNPYEIEYRLSRLEDDFLGDEYISQLEDYRLWGQSSKYNAYLSDFVLNRDTYVKKDYNNRPLYEFFEFHPRYKEDEMIKIIPFIDPDTGVYQRVYPDKRKKLEQEYENFKLGDLKPDAINIFKMPNFKKIKEEGDEKKEEIDEKKINDYKDIFDSYVYLMLNDKKKSIFEKAMTEKYNEYNELKNNRTIPINGSGIEIPNVTSFSSRLPDFISTYKSKETPPYLWSESFPKNEYKKKYFESWMTDEEYEISRSRYIDKYNQRALKWAFDAPLDYIKNLHDKVNASQKYLKSEFDSYIWLRDLKAIDKSASTHAERTHSDFRLAPRKVGFTYRKRGKRKKFRRTRAVLRILFSPIKRFFRFIKGKIIKPFFVTKYKETVIGFKRLTLRMITGMPLTFAFNDVIRHDISSFASAGIKYQKKKLKQSQLPFFDIIQYPFIKRRRDYIRARRMEYKLNRKIERFKSSPKVASLFVLPFAITTSLFMTWKFIESRNTIAHHTKEASLIRSNAMTLKGDAEDRRRLRNILYDEVFANKRK